MKKPLTLAILFSICLHASSQQRYAYLPEGKITFQTSTQQLLVSCKNSPQIYSLNAILADSSFTKQPTKRKWNLLGLKSGYTNVDSLISVLSVLRSDTGIIYASPILIYPDGTPEGLTNELIVRLKNSIQIDSLKPVFKQLGVTSIRANNYLDREYILTVARASKYDALDVANNLFETGLFEYCEPDFVRFHAFASNDPVYSYQWALQNTGQYNGVAGDDIKAYQAWCMSTGAGIKVAVLDLGVDLVHPDLAANLLPGVDLLNQGTGGAPIGDDAHGTACAGIIAAVANNNLGITGVAYSSKIIPVRVGENGTISTTTATSGINWAASATQGNADILSCSWLLSGSQSSSFNNAINSALTSGRGGKGCVILFSSGDANQPNLSNSYPANLPNVIA